MVIDGLSTEEAGLLGALNDGEEVTVLGVVQHARKLARHPVLVPILVDLPQPFEGRVMLGGHACVGHVMAPC